MKQFLVKKFEKQVDEKELDLIGFSSDYFGAMKNKSEFLKFKVFDLTVIQANILKQTALSCGSDCAVNKGCLINSVDKTDAVLFGTKKQLVDISDKLKFQQFALPFLGEEIRRQIDLKPLYKTKIMGILNLTEDSFSDGGKFLDFVKAVTHAKKMIKAGADMIDIGAESTRPDAKPVKADVQIKRILPVLQKLVEIYPEIEFSVDTRSAKVAEEVLKISNNIIINDVSGLEFDKKMFDVIVKNKAKVVICHSSDIPEKMQKNTEYKDVVDDIFKFLSAKIDKLVDADLPKENIIIDLGFGFGKTVEQNFELMKRTDEFLSLGCPILAGVSRKSFIQNTVKDADYDGLTAALNGELLLKGTSILRVHDVKKTKDVIELFSALL